MLNQFDRKTETVRGEFVAFRRLTDESRRLINGGQSPWAYEGRINGRDLELWTELGHWREDGLAHPFDLAIAAAK